MNIDELRVVVAEGRALEDAWLMASRMRESFDHRDLAPDISDAAWAEYRDRGVLAADVLVGLAEAALAAARQAHAGDGEW